MYKDQNLKDFILVIQCQSKKLQHEDVNLSSFIIIRFQIIFKGKLGWLLMVQIFQWAVVKMCYLYIK